MFLDIFFDQYKNYLFFPIYFLIGLLFQIEKMYSDEINKLHSDPKEYECEEEEKLYNFIMIDDKNSFDNLEKNKNIFIKRYYKSDKNNLNTYDNILTLRENILFAVHFYKPLHFYYLDYYVENKPELYTRYKLNTKTNDIIIDVPSNNNNLLIKKIIRDNYIEMTNVLEYSKKYSEEDFKGWENLYNCWINPIEPSDKINYQRLIYMSQDIRQIEINNIKYTEIYCMRNLIQKEFFGNLKELYGNEESPFGELNYLLTIYRINKTNGNIITIIH